MAPEENQGAPMGDATVGLRMPRSRGMQFVAKGKAADTIPAYEGAPSAHARRGVHGWQAPPLPLDAR